MSVIGKILSGLVKPLPPAPQEVFAAQKYAGTGAAQSINNGLNIAGRGGIVWTKSRTNGAMHAIWDTNLGHGSFLTTSGNGSSVSSTSASVTDIDNALTSFNANGFSLGADATYGLANAAGNNFISWTFCEANEFFKRVTISHVSGVANTVDLSDLGTIGMAVVKRASGGNGDWLTWHRTFSASDLILLNSSGGRFSSPAISVTGTTLTVAASQPTGTYVVYAWAHDATSDGCVHCGSFLTDLDGVTDVPLPWEPQFVLMVPVEGGGWTMFDTARGWDLTASDASLVPNLPIAENAGNYGNPTVSGFSVVAGGGTGSIAYIYMAIRKPT